MGTCETCKWFVKDDSRIFGDGYCTLLEKRDIFGNIQYTTVKYSSSCDNYWGFKTKKDVNFKSGCFLTSACVKYRGLADDCRQLNVLRQFRDTYMVERKGRAELVKEYYLIAPKIVEKIELSTDKEKYYDKIWLVIKKCVDCIDKKENEEALVEYKKLVEDLKKIFL